MKNAFKQLFCLLLVFACVVLVSSCEYFPVSNPDLEYKPEQPEQPEQPALDTVAAIVEAASKLAADAKLEGTLKITGKVTEITEAYTTQYKNISFKLTDGTAEILCFRCKGEAAEKLAIGDTITVTGEVQNYKGNTVEFVYAQLSDLVAEAKPVVSDKINIFGTEYATLAEALAAAKEGDMIYVPAGTYAEEVSIAVKGVSLVGPNYTKAGAAADRAEEAVFTKKLTIAADGVTVNGVKFLEEGNIVVAANDATITNVYMDPTSTTVCGGGNNRKACIVDSADVENLVVANLTISNCYIDAPGVEESYLTEAIALNNVNGLTITGCTITNTEVATVVGSFEGIMVYNVSGVVNITNNNVLYTTDGYVIVLGYFSNACTEINVIDNVFDGNALNPHTATLAFRSGTEALTINVIGNTFKNFNGSTYYVRSDTGSQIISKYNSFDANSKFKLNYHSSCTNVKQAICESNYYAAEQTTATSDYGVIKSLEELAAAYAEYKKAN